LNLFGEYYAKIESLFVVGIVAALKGEKNNCSVRNCLYNRADPYKAAEDKTKPSNNLNLVDAFKFLNQA
jgi:hypothetical protein